MVKVHLPVEGLNVAVTRVGVASGATAYTRRLAVWLEGWSSLLVAEATARKTTSPAGTAVVVSTQFAAPLCCAAGRSVQPVWPDNWYWKRTFSPAALEASVVSSVILLLTTAGGGGGLRRGRHRQRGGQEPA